MTKEQRRERAKQVQSTQEARENHRRAALARSKHSDATKAKMRASALARKKKGKPETTESTSPGVAQGATG